MQRPFKRSYSWPVASPRSSCRTQTCSESLKDFKSEFKGAREGNAALKCTTRYAILCHLLRESRVTGLEVLLILTVGLQDEIGRMLQDGEMENEKKIVEELKELQVGPTAVRHGRPWAQAYPISVIFVGIGSKDFKFMRELPDALAFYFDQALFAK